METTADPCACGENMCRLNRTMQYGNLASKFISYQSKTCLNRTMQYGNNNILDQYEKENKGFKSYYVVWKPCEF